MASVFRGVLEFFVRLGIYDVVLPFLLVFTIVFAILEKSKVLGTEKIGGEELTKKNLNAMVAFVTGFFVVASTRLVAIINETMANMVLLLIMSVCFLLLIGSFMKQTKEGVALEPGWATFFTIIMFVGLVLIFLNALDWLEPAWNFMLRHYDSSAIVSILMLGGIAGFIYLLTKSPSAKKNKDNE